MCLSLEALVVFLNLLPADIVTTEPERITVRATAAPAVWEAQGDLWCVDNGPTYAADHQRRELPAN